MTEIKQLMYEGRVVKVTKFFVFYSLSEMRLKA